MMAVGPTEEEKGVVSILIVDDNPDHIALAQAAFEEYDDWDIEIAGSLEQAFGIVCRKTFDIVLLDYKLPDGSGLDLLEWVKKDSAIIVVTGQGNEQLAVESLRRGACNYVLKNCLFGHNVLHAVEEVLKERKEAFFRAFHAKTVLMAISSAEDGRCIDVNENFLKVLGFERHEVIGHSLSDLDIWVDYAQHETLIGQAKENGCVHQANVAIRTKSGAVLHSLFSIDIVRFQGVPYLLTVMNDITNPVRAEDEPKALAARSEPILDAVPGIIMKMNADKVYTWANEAGMDFFGKEIVGKKALQYVDGKPRPFESGDPFLMGSQGGFYVENRQRRKDEQIRLLAWLCRDLRDADGNITGALSIARDITDQDKIQQQREDLICELESKNIELERSAYTLSHDLKAPLITISGYIGLLKKHIADGAREQIELDMDRIHNATERMAKLLDTLLEVSRLGQIVNPNEIIYMDDLAQEAIELLSGRINEARVKVTVMPGLPTVVGDRPRWLEVMQNLLDNAVKYMGNQDEPLIEVGWEETPDETVMYVRDNGIGILPRYHKRIFELFEQLDPAVEGSGVGLALVKRIVEIHGGRVWIESDGLNKGSTFYFTLSRSQAEKCQEVGQWTPGNLA